MRDVIRKERCRKRRACESFSDKGEMEEREGERGPDDCVPKMLYIVTDATVVCKRRYCAVPTTMGFVKLHYSRVKGGRRGRGEGRNKRVRTREGER